MEVQRYVSRTSHTIAAQVVYFRLHRRMTQAQVAAACGVSPPDIARLGTATGSQMDDADTAHDRRCAGHSSVRERNSEGAIPCTQNPRASSAEPR